MQSLKVLKTLHNFEINKGIIYFKEFYLMKKLLLLFIFIFPSAIIFGQAGIRGADIQMTWVKGGGGVNSSVAQVYCKLYTEELGRSTITFDWGDGTIDTLEGNSSLLLNSNIIQNQFYASHLYDTLGTYIYGIRDSIIISDVTNITTPELQKVAFLDTLILQDGSLQLTNTSAIFGGIPTNFADLDSEGAINVVLNSEAVDTWDSFDCEIIPFPTEGYTFPASDSLGCNETNFYWRKPTEIGKYAFAARLHEYRLGEKIGTSTRYFVINVTPELIVANNNLNPTFEFQIMPNPASDYIDITISQEFLEKDLTLIFRNTLGQVLHKLSIPKFEGDWVQRFDLSPYPNGIYFLTIQNESKIVTKEFIIQK